MRIVLLSTPTRVYAPNYIVPTGIMSIAAYLEQKGHEVRIVDAAALREPNAQIVRRVQEFDPQLIGVGGIITAYGYIIKLTHELRKAMPRIPIVLGGQVAINNDANCFRHMAIDYIILGYGEIAMEKLARHLRGELPIELIPGITYLERGEIVTNAGREFFPNINEMPLPAYHLIDMEHYATVNGLKFAKLSKYLEQTGKTTKSHRFVSIMGTLGCTDRCTFCIHEQEFVGLKVFSNEYLVNHIRHLKETYGIHVFSIGEEMFITKLKRAREFNNLMKEKFPDVYWYASTRADFVTPEMIAELETGNCFTLAWGFESGSQRMLDRMKKRMTREQNMLAYTSTDRSKLVSACSLMVGNVGEDNESVKETADAIRRANIGTSAVFFAAAYPGGRTWDWAVERGLIPDTHAYLLASSDKDAGVRINVNLTPYPNFILKAWQQILMWECDKQEQKKKHQLFSRYSLKDRLRRRARYFLGYTYIPTPIVRWIVEAYFVYWKLIGRRLNAVHLRKYEVKIDEDGAILPDRLIVGRPQRFVPDDRIAALVEKTRVRIPLKAI